MYGERFHPSHFNAKDQAAINREYGVGTVDVFVADNLRKRRKERVQRAADLYHKYFYRGVSGAVGVISDRTKIPLGEAILPVGFALSEVSRYDALPPVVKSTVDIFTYVTLAIGTLSTPNFARTPVSEKLGLQEREVSLDDEMQYIIASLNKFADAPALPFDELVPRAHDAVSSFLKEVDGYKTRGPKKIKKGILSKPFMQKLGIKALSNPMFNEVVTTSETFDDVVAHEIAHSKGVGKEDQAEVVGVLSMIQSGDPSLQYVGYSSWFWRLLEAHGFKITVSNPRKVALKLENLGLNERTLREFQDRVTFIRQEGYGSKFGTLYKRGLLAATGQEDINQVYVNKPVALLADYRLQKA